MDFFRQAAFECAGTVGKSHPCTEMEPTSRNSPYSCIAIHTSVVTFDQSAWRLGVPQINKWKGNTYVSQMSALHAQLKAPHST